MVTKRKATKPQNAAAVKKIVERGGKVSEESEPSDDTEIRFTLRMSQGMVNMVDQERKKYVGSISRNQWILEAIAEYKCGRALKYQRNDTKKAPRSK